MSAETCEDLGQYSPWQAADADAEAEEAISPDSFNSAADAVQSPAFTPTPPSTEPPRRTGRNGRKAAVKDEAWHQAEIDVTLHLASVAAEVRRWDTGRIDTDSQAGRSSLVAYLHALESACKRLKASRAARDFRQEAPARVRKIWMDGKRLYSVPILVKTLQSDPSLVMNQQVYPLSDQARSLSRELWKKMADVGMLLNQLSAQTADVWEASSKAQLRTALTTLDHAWAGFEQAFLGELAVAEAAASAIIHEGIEHMREMDRIGNLRESDLDPTSLLRDPEFIHHRTGLVDVLVRLNGMANPHSKGSVFRHEVMQVCETVIDTCLADGQTTAQASLIPSFQLACDAVDTFDDLCTYFYHLPKTVEELNPDLSENPDLARMLYEWESAWQLATAYVLNAEGQHAVNSLVYSVRRAQSKSPELAEMLGERSAEFFLVLPRLVWLSFLANPLELTPLLEPLLPHRFANSDHERRQLAVWYSEELLALMEDCKRTCNQLVRLAGPGCRDAQQVAESALTRSAILGNAGPEDGGHDKTKDIQAKFMGTLERWSMELQRHKAESWNRFSEVLVRCIDPQVEVEAA